MIDNLDLEAMRGLLRNLAERQPALILDIWEQQPQAEGPARQEQPHWCMCGKCMDMPTVEEELCCRGGQDNCLSLEPVSYC
ncbi:hypothetical protein HOLleu_00822 [Holothuria leucospilota]|uniref:P2X purinoreceptor 7 intracellular domain-containing protein n=1 Tax=Holothuria leucospilota TaxID=206669 RepID=A0A9Q1CQ65_HOLLE|nr:hypothetical protein HOLleu_00822 [Holothuria leucospilota]